MSPPAASLSDATALPAGPFAPARDTGRTRVAPAMLAMAVGGFGIGTGEFAIMGLLPEVAADIGVSIPQAGHVISAYAVGVVIGAPVLAVLTARWPRRTLMVVLMLLFALGNFASAMAPGYLSLNGLRFLTGLPHGTYFGTAALVAAALSPPGRRATAVALVMMGLTVATVLGVPLAAWVGEWLGWRAAFAMVGINGLLAAWLVWRHVPDLPANAQASPLGELAALKKPQVWLTLGIGAIGFGGLFSVFSYVKPTLLEVSGMPGGWVPVVLALFGLGMVVGNLVGARLADKWLMPTIGGVLVWALAVMVGFHWAALHPVSAAIGIFLVGTIGALGTGTQIRLMDVAGEAQSLAAALNHSAFNFANALGAWLGGLAISAGWGWQSTSWVGAALAVGGLVVFGASVTLARREAAQP
ncbi:MAG: MFS transporter [Pseudomonadota bacterium]|nr:MFS transporter [Pseudomonadota bacterium]